MKVVVLGGAGLTGRCAVRDLAESCDVSEIVIADVNLAKAREIADEIKRGNVSATYVDLRKPKDAADVLKGADVALNAAQYYCNLEAMEAALLAKVHYLDQGGLHYMTLKQWELHDRFKEAELTALLCMGNCVGISNVMARYAADKLDSVETIQVRDGWVDFTKGVPPFYVTWSISTLLDEFLLDAIIFENGEFKKIPPLSRREIVHFPEPVGKQEVYSTIHSEITTFPTTFRDKGIKNVNWMEGGPGFLEIKVLVDAGFGSDEPVDIDGTKVSPRNFLVKLLASRDLLGYPDDVVPDDWEAARVQVTGLKAGRKVTHMVDWISHSKKEWRANAGEYLVGVPSSIAVQMIGKGEIKERGVILPENSVDPKRFITELTRRGIALKETTSTDIG